MMRRSKISPVSILSFMVIFLSGCAHTASIKDSADVYGKPLAVNAPRIGIADFTDSRQNAKHIGQVAALAINEPQTPINAILTNRIASKLMEQGFNVQKIEATTIKDEAEMG